MPCWFLLPFCGQLRWDVDLLPISHNWCLLLFCSPTAAMVDRAEKLWRDDRAQGIQRNCTNEDILNLAYEMKNMAWSMSVKPVWRFCWVNFPFWWSNPPKYGFGRVLGYILYINTGCVLNLETLRTLFFSLFDNPSGSIFQKEVPFRNRLFHYFLKPMDRWRLSNGIWEGSPAYLQ